MQFQPYSDKLVVVSDIDHILLDSIRKAASTIELQYATIGPSGELNTSIRNSYVGFFEPGHWIEGIMWHIGAKVNSSLWNYSINGISPIQYSVYSKGGMYTWHNDELEIHNLGDLRRAITVVINITNRRYTGGSLYVSLPESNSNKSNLYHVDALDNYGSGIVMPAQTSHKVERIASGERHSIVGWLLSGN